MSSERSRIVLIFAAVAAVVGGGAYYFFKIYQPKQALKDAQEDVASWESRFTAARACLLGPTPASSKTSEALAIREMSPDPWDRGGCTPLISKLSRGDVPQTGNQAIDDAWTEIDHAAGKAATAFATHVGSSTTLTKDPLPGALDRLDAARAKLRATVQLPAAEQAGKPLPAAQIIPIQNGDTPITKLEIDALPSAHGIVLFGKTASSEVEVALSVGVAPQVGRVAPGGIRAVPDTSWGANAGVGEVRAGAFDAAGAMPAPTALPLVGSREVTAAAAVGTPTAGVIVYGGDQQLAIAHAHEGAITADSPLRIATGVTATDTDGRIALQWTTNDREHHARILKPGGDEPIVELTEVVAPGTTPAAKLSRPMSSSLPCLTRERAWMMFGTALISWGGGKPATKIESDGTLIGCTGDTALLRFALSSYALCTDTCRIAKLAGAPELATIAVVAGKLVGLAEHGSVLAVWHEDSPPTYFGLPEQATPVLAHEWSAMALSDDKVIDILARGDKTFVIVRIPAARSSSAR